MATTTKGFPYPQTGDGRPHIDQDIAALAEYYDALLSGLTDAEIGLLAGAGLFDGLVRFQTNTGSVRRQRGAYVYDGAAWAPAAGFGALQFYTPTLTVVSGTDPTLGSGGEAEGWFMEWGRVIFGQFEFTMSGSATIGSGTYRVGLLPNSLNTADRKTGTWSFFRPGGPNHGRHGHLRALSTTFHRLDMPGTGGGAATSLASTTTSLTSFPDGTRLVGSYRYVKA